MNKIIEEIYLKAGELIEISAVEGITFGFAESLTGGLISSSVVSLEKLNRSVPSATFSS